MTIKKTSKEQVTGANGKKEECFVCYFTEAEKPMILNRTNAKTITKVVGSPFVEDWIGKRVILGVDTVSAFGEMTEALRVRNIKPQQAAPTKAIDYSEQEAALRACETLEQLQGAYIALTAEAKKKLAGIKDEIKTKLTKSE
jgi:hypothetical protein